MGGIRWTKTEDDTVRKLSGVKTAEEIGLILGRATNGVHHRIKKLGLSGYLCGEHHWASKADNLKMAMLHTLFDAGFTAVEVHRMFNEPVGLSYKYLTQVKCSRYRKAG